MTTNASCCADPGLAQRQAYPRNPGMARDHTSAQRAVAQRRWEMMQHKFFYIDDGESA
jgi:hypothetical protein